MVADVPDHEPYKHGALTRRIIGAAYAVHNALGRGFLEKVYENALALELQARGMEAVQQQEVEVRYRDKVVGRYVADLIVEGKVIVEVKAGRRLEPVHGAQVINYLKATGVEVGLLINFGNKVTTKRKILDR